MAGSGLAAVRVLESPPVSAARPCRLREESEECVKAYTPFVKQNRTLLPCINTDGTQQGQGQNGKDSE